MCGIAGLVSPRLSLDQGSLEVIGRRMNSALVHRGPDASGLWIDSAEGVLLAHRRLAIVDLSENGAQPMVSPCGRFVIIYNGEIYNFSAIKDEIAALNPAFVFKGRSDTEVLLAAIVHWGVVAAIGRCNGMFAFAVWDRLDRSVTLVRDRLGEKPLYYALDSNRLLFASELSAMRASGKLTGDIDTGALADYLRFGYIPAPRTIWRCAKKLPPGNVLKIYTEPDGCLRESSPVAYWSLLEVARRELPFRRDRSFSEIDEDFAALLESAVRMRNFADVPIGAFLSGGLDSSATVTTLRAVSVYPVQTFTAGFESGLFDERFEAKSVATHLGTKHHEIVVRSREFFDLVARLPRIYDEPFADASQIASVLVCQFARTNVAVCFSGDGGDELFGGYSRYRTHAHLWRINRALRYSLGRNAGKCLETLARHFTTRFNGAFRGPLSRLAPGTDSLGPAIGRIAKLSHADTHEELYRHMMSSWIYPEDVFPGSVPAEKDVNSVDLAGMEALDYFSLNDQNNYLPDNNLMKMDRASMHCSLEVRVPLLDHRLVEFSWGLRPADKINNGRGKLPLRRYLSKYLPLEVLQRPKRGFGVPIAAWLRNELKSWAEDLIFSTSSPGTTLFDLKQVARLWALHQTGKFDYSSEIWTIAMFLNWHTCETSMSVP